ncbi:MAG: EamA family transporter [Eubacteriales bacterium]|nr:EamA family transporter [Eubacteriales bacterium]
MSVFLIVTAGVLWGCIGMFVRPLSALGLSSMEIVMLRAMVTAASMGIYLLLRQPDALRIRVRDLWCFIGTGICSILFFNYCYFSCISLTSLSVAAILLYTAPAMVMVLSFFLFGEKITGIRILALVMTFAGCVLVTGFGGSGTALHAEGILAGLGSGLGYALYSIFSRYALERGYTSLTITFYTFLTAGIGTLVLIRPGHLFAAVGSDISMLLFSVLFGITCTVLPYLAYTKGLQKIDNGMASILASIEPVTAALLGFVFFQERMTMTAALGTFLVIAAMVLCGAAQKVGKSKISK